MVTRQEEEEGRKELDGVGRIELAFFPFFSSPLFGAVNRAGPRKFVRAIEGIPLNFPRKTWEPAALEGPLNVLLCYPESQRASITVLSSAADRNAFVLV